MISKLCVAVHLYLKLKFPGCNDKSVLLYGLSTHRAIGSQDIAVLNTAAEINRWSRSQAHLLGTNEKHLGAGVSVET